MATENVIQGILTMSADDVKRIAEKWVGLPPEYKIAVGRVRVDGTTGILTCKYNASNVNTPEPPVEGT